MATAYSGIIEKLREYQKRMLSPERRAHIVRMEEDSCELCKIHEVNLERLTVAIDAHDLFRDVKSGTLRRITRNWKIKFEEEEKAFPILLHGKVASEFLKRYFKVEDREILDAVTYHTSGIPTESKIVMCLVILDTVEHGRHFEGVNFLRETARNSLEKGYKEVIRNKIMYALERNLVVLRKSVETWNHLVGVER